MKAMNCRSCRIEIEDMDAGLSAPARAHLESCALCREFGEERLALKRLVSSLGSVSAPNDFDWQLRARLAAEKDSARRRSSWLRFAPSTRAISVAASFALLLAVAIAFKQMSTKKSESRVSSDTAIASSAHLGQIEPSRVSAEPDSVGDGGNNQGAGGGATASSLSEGKQRRRTQLPRTRRAVGESQPRMFVASGGRSVSQDLSSQAAPVITLFSVPLRTPSQPVRIMLNEAEGSTRTVSLQPVTFGSQEIIERTRKKPAGELADNSQGIW